jgi:hypothetical protein
MSSILFTLALDERLRRHRLFFALALFALILVLGSIPGARAEIGQFSPGVVLHSLAYSGLTFLLYTGGKGSRSHRAAKAVLIIAVMGALDEFVQSFFPYRNATVTDWLVDCFASLLTATLLWRFVPGPLAPAEPQ